MKAVNKGQLTLSELPHKRLLRTLEPEPDESYPGYILRLVEANGYDTVTWITNLAKLPYIVRQSIPRLQAGAFDLATLAILAGTELGKLEKLPFSLTLQPDGSKQYTFPSGLLPYHVIPAIPYKVCPGCLSEAPYLRRAWDVLPITTCVRHSCLLVDHCEGCGKRLPWSRRKLCCCPCGYDWRQSTIIPVEHHELDLTRYFTGFIGLTSPIDVNLRESRSSPLFDCSPSELLTSLSIIICHWEPDARRLGLRRARNFSNAQLHQLLCRALTVFDRWPHNLYRFLSEHSDKMVKELAGRRSGVVYEFPLFIELDRSPLYRNLHLLRNGFEEFVKTQWSGGHLRSTKRIVGHIKEVSRYVSYYWAKTKLSSVNGLDYLINEGKIRRVEHILSNGKKTLLLERADVLSALAERQKFLLCWQVSKQLGLSEQGRVLELMSGGFLQRQYPFGKERRIFFSKGEVDALLATLDARTVPFPNSQKELWTFEKVRRHCGHYDANLVKLIRAIIDGKLSICATASGVGFNRYLFLAEEVQHLLNLQRHEQDKAVAAMSIDEARLRLRIPHCAISWLIKQKLLLAQRRISSGRPAFIIKETDLVAFQQTYISAWHLAASINTRSYKLIPALRLHNVLPATSPSSGLIGERTFFRRSDVTGLDLAEIVRVSPAIFQNKSRSVRVACVAQEHFSSIPHIELYSLPSHTVAGTAGSFS